MRRGGQGYGPMAHATFADEEEEGHHPEAHGDPFRVDSDNRQYFAWQRPARVSVGEAQG